MAHVELVLTLVALVAVVVVVARLCEPIGLPPPLALLVVGIIGSELPFIPEVPLTPEVALVGLLPPLLYAAAQGTSIADIKAYRGGILGLSVGLVLFTAFGVALVAQTLLPISFAIALALGAIVAPPDAVAATAVARRMGLPRRITTILEGESLFNDATALVTLRTAVAAVGLAVGAEGVANGEVTILGVVGSFAWAVVGGVGVGVLTYIVIGKVRHHLNETAADTALSWIVPFLAYIAAEEVHASGVFAVVTAGLGLSHSAPRLQSAASRLSERSNWASITFVLENAVFLLIGLQLAGIVDDVRRSSLGTSATVVAGLAVLATVIVLRPVWMIPFTWLSARRDPGTAKDRLTQSVVGSWAGMRGVVTLAAALTLPLALNTRSNLVMIALIVTVGTLLLQGLTLPALARALDVRGPDPREDALQEATVVQAVTAAGLRTIETIPGIDPSLVVTLKEQGMRRVNRVWERISSLGQSDRVTPSEAYRSTRLTMIGAEREELLTIRDGSSVDQPIILSVLSQLDAEEAALTWGERKSAAVREAPLRAPDVVAGACVHLDVEPSAHTPLTPEGCQECLAEGRDDWVALRMCTHCGHVGCCDSSPRRHATHHFEGTSHPVMRSLEPGELWRWCFVDHLLG